MIFDFLESAVANNLFRLMGIGLIILGAYPYFDSNNIDVFRDFQDADIKEETMQQEQTSEKVVVEDVDDKVIEKTLRMTGSMNR